jgi:hexosaminidase
MQVPGNEEGYAIEIDPAANTIHLMAKDDPGMFYAIQSLKALAQKDGDTFLLPEVRGFDAPRFPYRGMHLDVVRNFHPKEEVKDYIL